VSPYLTNSILISEDGLFFHHKGFLESALRASIIQNIKEKKFARGGSTISMQLVKNLWLSKEKTLARKLEEALIVWLIENKRLISKERMFEIYLNIIEWGPDVYGAKEASQYYFEKDPDMLSIEEAIFLTSIIPKPKKFKWSFDKEQNLKPYLADYYKLVASKLLKREIISEKDTARLIPNVKLTGKAKLLLNGNDSDPTEEDSLHFDDYKNIILQNSDEILPDSTDSTN
jgi:membrane peptidoglycan carboxypeptidase